MKNRIPTSILAALVVVSFFSSMVACDVGIDRHGEHSHARANLLNNDVHGGNQTEIPSLRRSDAGSGVDLCCAVSFFVCEFEPATFHVNAPNNRAVHFARAISPDISVPSPIPIPTLAEG